MCVANGLRCTDTCQLAHCENQASDSEESSDEKVEDVDYENYYDY